jgi:PhzF family phenazine biosynthesis protein
MTSRDFQQVDVFSDEPFAGNPVAVVADADGLTTDEMQRLARWTNLSETTFLLPPTTPDADYRVRIFTLARELPFAGHPTLGSCHAWLELHTPRHDAATVVQECGAGLVTVRRGEDGVLAFAAPPLVRSGPLDDALTDRVARVLGVERDEIVDAAWVDNGPGWVGVLLADAEQALELAPDLARAPSPDGLDVGVVGPYPPGGPCAFEVRGFFTDQHGELREDPVTGSLNASLAQWLLVTGRATAPYVVSQGTALGRAGRPRIEQDADGAVWVGGRTVTRIQGRLLT